jgi:4-amino-4-deoxy-L-arabinose transferase-like glycosyltransferase
LVTALAALVAGWRRLSPLDRIALVAVVPGFLLVGSWSVKTIRYVLPLVPPMILAAGALVARLTQRARSDRSERSGLARRAVAGVIVGWTVAYGVAFTLMFTEPDPRTRAARFIAERAEPGDSVVLGLEASYTAPLAEDAAKVGVVSAIPSIETSRLWEGLPAPPMVAAHLEARLARARFLVVDDFYLRRGLHPEARERAPEQHTFYEALLAGRTGYERVATFRPEPALGPLRWDERDDEILAVCFDHCPVSVWERRGDFDNPLF